MQAVTRVGQHAGRCGFAEPGLDARPGDRGTGVPGGRTTYIEMWVGCGALGIENVPYLIKHGALSIDFWAESIDYAPQSTAYGADLIESAPQSIEYGQESICSSAHLIEYAGQLIEYAA